MLACLYAALAFIGINHITYSANSDKLTFTVDKSKNINFATSKVKKNVNLTIGLLSLGIYDPGPQVWANHPQILRGVRI